MHFTPEVELNEYSSTCGNPNCISLYGVASLHKTYGALTSNGDATCICVSETPESPLDINRLCIESPVDIVFGTAVIAVLLTPGDARDP